MADVPLKKGDRVQARQLGMADVTGKITWVGPSKYGPGLRYGIKDDSGQMYWVDEENVEREGGPNVKIPAALQKGARVRVTAGPHEGVEGDVYLSGPTGRIGVRDDDENTYWVERDHLATA